MADLVKNDEELAAMENEVMEDTQMPQGEPEEAELDSGFELEIVDPSLYGGAKPEALVQAEQKLAALEAQNRERDATAGRDDATAANMAAIKQMQEQLAGGITVNQPTQAPASAMFDQVAHRAKYNKNLYNDPAKETEEFIAPYMMELNNKIDSVNQRADRNASKADMLENGESRSFYGRHKDEIDIAMSKLPADTEVYQKALASVQTLHMEEIVAEKVAEALANLPVNSGAKPHLTNVGKPAAPALGNKTQVTPGMQRYMHEMSMKGMGDKKWLLSRAKQLKAEGRIVN